MNKFLYDELVALVPLEDEHAPILTPWLNNPEMLHNIGFIGGLSEAEERDFLKAMRTKERDKVLGIASVKDERLIGVCGLHFISALNSNAEFGIFIGDSADWGKGYGTAATRLMLDYGFNTLNLNRIGLEVFDYNERGKRSYEKLGFLHEGTMVERWYKDGSYIDVHMMAMLRREFNEQHADWRAAQRNRYGIG